MNTTTDLLTSARAAALFASDVSTTEQPTRARVDAAIRNALRTHGGIRGCTAALAAAYGDYPELAPARMRWARRIVEHLYDRQLRRNGPEQQRQGERRRVGVANTAAAFGRPASRTAPGGGTSRTPDRRMPSPLVTGLTLDALGVVFVEPSETVWQGRSRNAGADAGIALVP
jgi:hypothetical protein